jgi:apolipoprotein N-acyltransferase
VRRPARRGLQRAGLAAAGGLLLYAAHPPVDLGVAGVMALVPLVLLARDLRDSGGSAAGWGWGMLAGVVFFAPLLWWMERFGVVAWVLLAGLQAVFVALYVAVLAAWRRPGWAVGAVVWWVALEVIRTVFPLGGFPWGVLGYSQHGGGPLLGVARTFGVLGVSAACATVGVCLALALVRARRRPADAVAPLLVVGLVVGGSALVAGRPPPPTGVSVDTATVQGNDIESTSAAGVARVATGRIVRVAQQMTEATRPLAENPPALTVWPENSIDVDLADSANVEVRAQVAEALRLLDGSVLLAGADVAGPRPATRYVTMAEVTPAGRGQTYVKRKPVPFGEYVPGRAWLGRLPPLQQIPTDVLPGDGPQVLELAGARIGALLCFENVFPGLARSQVRDGAELLVVSTNNASFGRTPMSRQHLAFSQLRAVENGRWVLHAGISGISGVVDPHGRVTQRTELFEAAIVRAELPLVRGLTPATRLGDAVGTAALAVSLIGLAVLAADRRRVAPTPPAG